MSTRKIVNQKIKEYQIQEYVKRELKQVGLSSTRLQMTPLGEKIIIAASRPGLIVGRKGQSIKKLTSALKKKFGLENPQIEISEVESPNLDAHIIAERIANSLERFGAARFKGVGHKCMDDIMSSGALGTEILITGKIPSSRAKRWRFYQGYLKKSGDIALEGVRRAYTEAQLKTGTVGIQVRIMPPDITLPDKITLAHKAEAKVEEVTEEKKEKVKEKKKEEAEKTEEKEEKAETKKKAKKKTTKKKTAKKKEEKKEEFVEEVKEEETETKVEVEEGSEGIQEVSQETKKSQTSVVDEASTAPAEESSEEEQ